MKRRITFAGLLALLVGIAVGCAVPEPQLDPAQEGVGVEDEPGDEIASPTSEEGVDTLSLIDAAMAGGRLDYSTGMLYKVYAMFEPESLPQEYETDVPSKCGTPLILEVQRNWERIDPDDQAEISKYIQPLMSPDDETELDDVTRDRTRFSPNREQ